MAIKVIRKGVYVRERSPHRRRQRVWRVEEVVTAIQAKAPLEPKGYRLYDATPARIATAKARGDAVVKAARLGPASHAHNQGSTRAKNMDLAWVPVWDLEIVQSDDPGWKEGHS